MLGRFPQLLQLVVQAQPREQFTLNALVRHELMSSTAASSSRVVRSFPVTLVTRSRSKEALNPSHSKFSLMLKRIILWSDIDYSGDTCQSLICEATDLLESVMSRTSDLTVVTNVGTLPTFRISILLFKINSKSDSPLS